MALSQSASQRAAAACESPVPCPYTPVTDRQLSALLTAVSSERSFEPQDRATYAALAAALTELQEQRAATASKPAHDTIPVADLQPCPHVTAGAPGLARTYADHAAAMAWVRRRS